MNSLKILNSDLYRESCWTCHRAKSSCYCEFLKPFDPKAKFVILIHPIEWKRKIASGRMSHLMLQNSEFIKGEDYSQDDKVNSIISNKNNQCFVIYPSINSVNISNLNSTEKENIFEKNKTKVFFMIDGTWHTAQKTMHVSKNLNSLPTLSFIPPTQSNFRVRKQPKENFLSTIEAIHYTIELLGDSFGFATSTRIHDGLIDVFNKSNDKQYEYVKEAQKVRIYSRHPKTIENLKRKFEITKETI